jgi:gliding motility-associated-like protein
MSIVSIGNDLKSDSYNPGNETFLDVFAPGDTITGTIARTSSVCLKGTPPVITFTGKEGKSPYTFIYKINDGPEITTNPTLNGKDTLTIKAPTDVAGVFKYTLVNVKDATNKSFFKNNSSQITITVNPPPNTNFDFTNDNTCSGTPIQFSPSLTGSYFYWWEFGDSLTSSLGNPVHEYYATGTSTQDFKIKFRITNPATGCKDSTEKKITVKQIPHAALDSNGTSGATYFDKTNKLFVNCGATQTSPQFTFVAVNASKTRASNTSYSIDWGDKTPVENLPASFTKITHSYNSLGFFNIKLISYNDKSECKTGVSIYKFFNGNSPGGNLGSVPNVNDCAPYTVKWPVQNTAGNPPGTTYEFTIDDDLGTKKIYDIYNLPDTIEHTFTKTSCGKKNNKFTVKFTATNPCDKSETTLQVMATEKPTAKISNVNYCVKSPATITSVSTGTFVVGNTCVKEFDEVWEIFPKDGWESKLGNGNEINVEFKQPGEYQIKLKIDNPYTTENTRCTIDSMTQTITINPLPTATISGNVTVCQYDASPEITFTGAKGTAPYTFTYTYKLDDGTLKTETIKTTGTNNSIVYKAPTDKVGTHTYSLVSVQESSLSAFFQAQTGDVKIIVNPAGQVNNPGDQFVCNGVKTSINFSTKNTIGTTTYSWTNSNTDIGLDASGNGNISFTPANTGNSRLTTTISVVPTYTANGVSCEGKPEQFTVTVNPTPTVDQPADQTVCNGYYTTDIKFTGTTPNTIYNWKINKQIGLWPLYGTGDILAFKAINTGGVPVEATVEVTPVINECDTSPKSFKITINPSPLITNPLSGTYCIGDKPLPLSVTYTNAVETPTYQWYSKTSISAPDSIWIENETNSSFNPPSSTIGTMYYYCVITFPTVDCNTFISDFARIIINPIPVVSSVDVEINSGDFFTVKPNNLNGDIVPLGTTYVWPMPEISPPGSVDGASEQLKPVTEIRQQLKSKPGVSFVTYTVTPISGTCKGDTFKIKVKVNVPLKINETVKQITCFGAKDGSIQTNIEGGAPFHTGSRYNTTWTGPDGFNSTDPSISNLKPGDYKLVFADSLGPRDPIVYTISEPNELIVTTIIEKDLSYFGTNDGEIDISVSGGTGAYKYTWTRDGATVATTEDIKNLIPGVYKITVTDINNCGPKIMSFTITEPSAIVIQTVSQTNVKCFGQSTGAVSIKVQGGTMLEITQGKFDYKYSWTGPNDFKSNEKDLNNIPAGNYLLTVTENSGFKKTHPVEITEAANLLISTEITPITCYGDNNASLRINVSGGVSPYKFNWGNSFLNGDFNDSLSAGDYSITITDANFCEKTITVNIPEAKMFRINPEIKHVSCFGANNGRIALNFEGGNQPITFAWKDNPNAGATRNNIAPGTYTVDIAEGGGCIISKTFTIIEPMPLILTASITSVFDCNIDNGGAIDLSVIGGIPPYKYSWSNGAKTEDLSKIPAGNYLVTVTDSVGCSITEKFTINRPPSITVDVIPKIEYCNSDSLKGIYTAVVSGGVPPYQLAWVGKGKVSGINNERMETDQSGTVVLKVIDSANCSAIKTFQTKIPKLGISDSLLNCNQRKYQFKALVANEGLEVYSYKWDFGDSTSSTLKEPEHSFSTAGIFKVSLSITNLTNQCESVYEQIIDVEPRPNVKIEGPEKFCEGNSIVLNAKGTDIYTWSDGTKKDNILITQEGIYGVTGSSVAGCSNTDTYSVSFFDPIIYSIQSDKKEVTFEDRKVIFSAKYTPDTYYTWDFGDNTLKLEGVGISNPPPHQFNINGDGHFDVKLTVTNPNLCIEEDSVEIGVNLISIPNTFTPNGDGKNDFYLEGWNKKIFNRNGVLMFEGVDGWDGNYKGKPVANDTYFVVVYDSAKTGSTPITSFITVFTEKYNYK